MPSSTIRCTRLEVAGSGHALLLRSVGGFPSVPGQAMHSAQQVPISCSDSESGSRPGREAALGLRRRHGHPPSVAWTKQTDGTVELPSLDELPGVVGKRGKVTPTCPRRRRGHAELRDLFGRLHIPGDAARAGANVQRGKQTHRHFCLMPCQWVSFVCYHAAAPKRHRLGAV